MEKVVLLRFSSLGDVVLTSALVEPLVKNGFRPLLVTYQPFDQLFKEDKRLDVFAFRKGDFFKNLLQLKDLIEQYKPKAVLDLHKNLKTLLLKSLIRAPIKVSYPKNSLQRRACVFFNRLGAAKSLKRRPFNVVEAYGETLKALGIEANNLRPKIELNPQKVERTLETYNLTKEPYIVIGVGARYRKKRYPYFGELSSLLNREGFKVVLIGDKRDFELTKEWKDVINLCGKVNLLESLHILKGAAFYIGNDSGATHMARAVGKKVVVIYGGTHPCLGFAPYPDEGIVISKYLDCSPCDLHGKGKCKRNFECLEIPPKEVLRHITPLLERNL